MTIKLNNKYKQFSGSLEFYSHESKVNQAPMNFAVYLPDQIEKKKLPVLYWLSGLTCTEENFMIKAGAQKLAAELGIVLVTMDTSPRNLGIEGEDENYYFGSGAGFYLNATQEPWSKHYNMYDYVTQELPEIIEANFNVNSNKSICGHSMGGHGALSIALKNPGLYKSASALSPIVAPMKSLWGESVCKGYLGDDKETWKQYDTCELIRVSENKIPLFVDQGTEDEFLKDQLKPELLQQVCEEYNHPLNLRMQQGYDHSYYFVATFINDHLRYHARFLM